ncbi:hypothetical protein R3W88_033204 [Solanum pinnatisectum]|uniref:Uncharacterized protein n=1 Tax=Solanum pinnatisectum TaxID=50273 RepID=A0AAV9K4Y3_9SOLN|nr:hypothetical protein R3W88_033204 [Solanum pinnatisectum]
MQENMLFITYALKSLRLVRNGHPSIPIGLEVSTIINTPKLQAFYSFKPRLNLFEIHRKSSDDILLSPFLFMSIVPFEFSSELGVVQTSENSINRGSRVALGEHPQLIAQQTSVHPQLIARDAATSSYVIEHEETTDIRDENVNAKEDDSDLPSNLDNDSELDEDLRAFRTERRKKIHQNKKRKVPVPTPG